jgi:sugar/nucleoside kinase (ribokinase family)
MSAPRLIVVGSVAYDSIETPTRDEKDVLGGSATYFSLASQALVPTGVVAVIGEDFRPEHRQLLAHRGVDLQGLVTEHGETFRWGGRYDAELKDRETLFTLLNVFADFSPRMPADYKAAPYLFLANIDPELQLDVLNQCTGPRFVACDTMNFWIQGKLDSLMQLLPRIDALFLNDTEAYELTGHRNLLHAARWIQDHGTPIAVIKKGEHGAVIITRDDVIVVPAFLLDQVEDPTGAGDTFAGGMVGTLARLDDTSPDALRLAAAVGTVTASFCVQEFGPHRLADLPLDAIQERLQAYWQRIRTGRTEL